MAKHRTHRTHSIAFKRQVVQEYLAGETLHGLARRHDLSRTLIRIWVDKYEAGAFDEDAEAADTIQEYEARIAALERLVGKQALELDFLKGVQFGRLLTGSRASAPMLSVIDRSEASASRPDRACTTACDGVTTHDPFPRGAGPWRGIAARQDEAPLPWSAGHMRRRCKDELRSLVVLAPTVLVPR